MDAKILTLVIIAVLILAYTKIRNLIFKAKDNSFVKDDTELSKKQEQLKETVEALKTKVEATDLNPEEVEVFWQGKKNE